VTVREPALVPRVFQQAFHLMRSGRPGPVLIDLPFDVQMAEIDFDSDTYEPLAVYKPAASARQIDKALDLLAAAEKPLLVAGGGVFNADAADLLKAFAEEAGVPVVPTLMGWGVVPDDHPLMAGMVGLQTSHRYGNASMLAADFVFGIGNRWANRHTGSVETYTQGKKIVHIDIEPTQIGRVFEPTLGIASDAKPALELLLAGVKARKAAGTWPSFAGWARRCAERKRVMLRESHFTQVPMKPMRVYEEMNKVFGRDTTYVTTIGLSQIAAAQFLHVYGARQWINCGQAGPLGWTIPAALGVAVARPHAPVVGISGDYDFQFLIEELAVGAQFRIPYVHVLVNNAYLGLIRQAQRNFDMDYCVQLAFENQNMGAGDGEVRGYGVDHVAVVRGLGCQALRVTDPEKVEGALRQAQQLALQHRVPVVVECILERVTNVAMGTEIDRINEFEPIDCRVPQGLTTVGLLD
jgi:tartronate-semialdehyde synthase